MLNGQEKNFTVGIDPNQRKKPSSFEVNNDSKKPLIFLILALTCLTLLAVWGGHWWYVNKIKKPILPPVKPVVIVSTTTLKNVNLPSIENLGEASSTPNNLESAVSLSYGELYVKDNQIYENKIPGFDLPLNVKTQTINYYEVARKMPLDAGLDNLNTNGYAFVPSTKAEVKNFYSAYQDLIKNNVPQLLTTDFLLYDFENHLKEIYSDIKTQVFYKDIWAINKKMFDIANNRYIVAKKNSTNPNDILVEAERLEAAYFAVPLMLLTPRGRQINDKSTINPDLFSPKEVKDFSFILPDYLRDDVNKEVALILSASKISKSPVMLYQRDYKSFANISQTNAHLLNFSLAIKWHNSEFPLFARNDTCVNCTLDENDWLVNFVAANLIATDFKSAEDLRDIWARIYKISSFFEGLRKELTYKQYVDALNEKEGSDYSLDILFSSEKSVDDKMQKAKELRDFIVSKYSFNSLEGGYDRANAVSMPLIGMRMLQESYWPDDHIFGKFSQPVVGKYSGPAKLPYEKNKYKLFTACSPNSREFIRCRPMARDLLNIISPITNDEVFSANTQFDNYDTSLMELTDIVNQFNNDSWHENIYWTLLNVSKNSIIGVEEKTSPMNTTSIKWSERNNNSILGSWVNLKTEPDKYEISLKQEIGLTGSAAPNVFIEPNPVLIGDLLANAKMVNTMLEKLNITNDVQYSNKKLTELIDNLTKIQFILTKQLSGEKIAEYEQLDMLNIIGRYTVTNNSKKSVRYAYKNMSMIEKIDGIRFVVGVYAAPEGKILVAGPVFNYTETN
ncbi:MAG: DUF3160 domain-containing protein [bacterium]